jgi:hypothetical protein
VAEGSQDSWATVNQALYRGFAGLPGGSSLPRLLAEHRGKRHRMDLPRLTIEQILAWADAHHAVKGRWPTAWSGPVAEGSPESWATVNAALYFGYRGLPGGSSLARVLDEHRRCDAAAVAVEDSQKSSGFPTPGNRVK